MNPHRRGGGGEERRESHVLTPLSSLGSMPSSASSLFLRFALPRVPLRVNSRCAVECKRGECIRWSFLGWGKDYMRLSSWFILGMAEAREREREKGENYDFKSLCA